MGNWEARPLSREQRAYAALDAFMGECTSVEKPPVLVTRPACLDNDQRKWA